MGTNKPDANLRVSIPSKRRSPKRSIIRFFLLCEFLAAYTVRRVSWLTAIPGTTIRGSAKVTGDDGRGSHSTIAGKDLRFNRVDHSLLPQLIRSATPRGPQTEDQILGSLFSSRDPATQGRDQTHTPLRLSKVFCTALDNTPDP